MQDFDDNLDDLIGGAARANRAPVSFKPATERVFTENCAKCGGTGLWRGIRKCFACDGKGTLQFKTSRQDREKARDTRQDRKARDRTAFAAEHKAEIEWVFKAADRQRSSPVEKQWDFPAKMVEAIQKWDSWTDGQITAIRKCMIRSDERRAEQQTNAPAIDISLIEQAFAKAGARLAKPKLHVAIESRAFTISHAGANSKNSGALYVKEGEEYLGKIMDGKFLAVRSCGAEREANVLQIAADPETATIKYGRLTGRCGCCGRTLTDPKSIERGIGPICAEGYGW